MKQSRVFVIAEIGSNHNQDIDQAFYLMNIAKQAGADAVKFQSLKLDAVIAEEDISQDDIELFNKIKLDETWYRELYEYARKIGIECISAPTYLQAIMLLKENGARYMKIASPQTYGFPELIKKVAQLNIKTIMSTGYCEEGEIERAVNLYQKYGDLDNLTLLHCISQYPTEVQKVNLNYMKVLQNKYGVSVGYSDHTLGIVAPVMAVAMGATVIEKHLTLSRKMEGPDHYFALEPDEFQRMVTNIREAEQMIGTGEKILTSFEKEFRDSVIMYPYAARDMKPGEQIEENDIRYFRSKTRGMSPWRVEQDLIGKVLEKTVMENHKFE